MIIWKSEMMAFGEFLNGPWSMKKIRMDPVDPSQVPAGYFEAMDMKNFPSPCHFLCFRLEQNGRKPMENIIQINTDAEASLKQETEEWLKPALGQ